jgi:hypothetical protein
MAELGRQIDDLAVKLLSRVDAIRALREIQPEMAEKKAVADLDNAQKRERSPNCPGGVS